MRKWSKKNVRVRGRSLGNCGGRCQILYFSSPLQKRRSTSNVNVGSHKVTSSYWISSLCDHECRSNREMGIMEYWRIRIPNFGATLITCKCHQPSGFLNAVLHYWFWWCCVTSVFHFLSIDPLDICRASQDSKGDFDAEKSGPRFGMP